MTCSSDASEMLRKQRVKLLNAKKNMIHKNPIQKERARQDRTRSQVCEGGWKLHLQHQLDRVGTSSAVQTTLSAAQIWIAIR